MNQQNIEAKIDKILFELQTEVIKNIEAGVYIVLPTPRATKQLVELYREAGEADEYGNPMIQLNIYEAEHVSHLIKNSDPQRFDTGDWFKDVPFKIEKKLKELANEA